MNECVFNCFRTNGLEVLLKRDQLELEKPSQKEKEQEVTWYHEGPESLREARRWIAGKIFSIIK